MPHRVEMQPSFEDYLKSRQVATEFIEQKYQELEAHGLMQWLQDELEKASNPDADQVYPGQGLIATGYEDEGINIDLEKQKLADDLINKTIHGWLYYLFLFNHPERLEALTIDSAKDFSPPQKKFHPFFFLSRLLRRSVTINDLKLSAAGSHKPRVQRTQAHKKSLNVSYQRPMSWKDNLTNRLGITNYNRGRAQARNVIVGAANPEITGTPMKLATLAQAHSLVCVPRDGLFANIERQVDLVTETFRWFEKSPVLVGLDPDERAQLLDMWQHNLIGTLEANPEKAHERAAALYAAGVRTFRIYSPEPSSAPLETLKLLRKMEQEAGWEPIEIFVGQVVDVKQALALEAAGANALYFGIGGGGRCITGVVAGLTINWPELVWRLRGKIKIPMIVEGGANDHLAESLAVGASGIGAAGKFAGTIETPGGTLFFVDALRKLFKFYGGEASDRMRVLAGRIGPLDYVLNREGETRNKYLRNGGHDLPTSLQVLYEFMQGIVAGLVFQNADSIAEFQDIAADSLRQASPNDDAVRHTH